MTGRAFTWRVSTEDAAELVLTATADGLVTVTVEPPGAARLAHYQRAALAVALEGADRTAAGLLARREREAGR